MMYVIFNNDGSIKEKNLNEIIVQGSNNVAKIGVAIEDVSTDDYTIVGICKLSNGDIVTSLPSDDVEEIKDGVNGIVLSLTEDMTALPGTLRINIQAIRSSDDKVITTYTVYLLVNEGVNPGEVVMMTVQQYQGLVTSIEGLVTEEELQQLQESLNEKADKIGALPQYSILNSSTLILDFINTNSLDDKIFLLYLSNPLGFYFGKFAKMSANIYGFYFEKFGINLEDGGTKFVNSTGIDLTNKTFADILIDDYKLVLATEEYVKENASDIETIASPALFTNGQTKTKCFESEDDLPTTEADIKEFTGITGSLGTHGHPIILYMNEELTSHATIIYRKCLYSFNASNSSWTLIEI